MSNLKRFLLSFYFAILGLFAASAWAATYSVQDLGVLSGGTSDAASINNNSQVVGSAAVGTMGYPHAFSLPDYNWVMTDLGMLASGYSSSAAAINNNGQIAGQSTVNGSSQQDAFLYSNGTMTDIGSLAGYGAQAFGLNDNGQVVGQSGMSSSGFPFHAFLYNNGVMTDLGTLGGDNSSAHGINNAGQVVGSAFTSLQQWNDDRPGSRR